MQSVKDVEKIVNNTSDEYIPVHRDTLKRLLESYRFLDELHEAGVDNWEGYSIAYRELKGDKDE